QEPPPAQRSLFSLTSQSCLQIDQLAEAGEEVCESSEAAGKEQDAQEHEERARHPLDRTEPALQPLRTCEECVESDGRDEEWNAEAERVGAEEHHAARHRRLHAGIQQDGGE